MSKEWLLQKPGAETGRQGCCPELTARKPEAVGAGSYQGGRVAEGEGEEGVGATDRAAD